MATDNGYIYCMSSSVLQNAYKIGMTKRSPKERLHEANHSTWVLTDFTCDIAKQVSNPGDKEWAVHKLLETYRINKNKEFFDAPLSKIRQAFKFVSGDEQSFVGLAFAKEFKGNMYVGYIKSYNAPLWRVNYDDGDREDLDYGDWKELIIGIKNGREFGKKKLSVRR